MLRVNLERPKVEMSRSCVQINGKLKILNMLIAKHGHVTMSASTLLSKDSMTVVLLGL